MNNHHTSSNPHAIVGRNSVLELLRGGGREIEGIQIAQGRDHPRLRRIISLAKKKGVRCEFVPRSELDLLEPTIPHQGVIALVSPKKYLEISALLEQVQAKREDRPPLIVMLDGVQDPRNLGAVVRTADAVGVDGIVIPKDRAAGVNTTVHKASAGSAEYIPVAQVTNLARTIERIKASDIWVVGADQDAPQIYTQADFTVPLCLVLGNEAEGLRRLVREKCDSLVQLPMHGHLPSLNVSVAAGVLLYEVLRQRTHE
ncbi:MAG: 23S rRNA (guanosine(2251)-2'-O)-methyltransferase RlmB [Candidatus Poribacteria bacterium]|nr:23S rRNA (guanosine(2251)-2'-O)-methyltransferase RlmB [Candidatus Poribacteria bacterium]MDE0502610.1 23S rRNA (guanosine(2251)-2'-O)-methyltransferase RlmB [Candidatus Poribacteria bacterium]